VLYAVADGLTQAQPGCEAELPHVWLELGKVSVHDRIGDGFTLLRLGRSRDDPAALAEAFTGIGAPFSVLDIDSDAARRIYGFDYLLVSDLHVVGRGDTLPDRPQNAAFIVTGHRRSLGAGAVVVSPSRRKFDATSGTSTKDYASA
jgi:hypothetical protein